MEKPATPSTVNAPSTENPFSGKWEIIITEFKFRSDAYKCEGLNPDNWSPLKTRKPGSAIMEFTHEHTEECSGLTEYSGRLNEYYFENRETLMALFAYCPQERLLRIDYSAFDPRKGVERIRIEKLSDTEYLLNYIEKPAYTENSAAESEHYLFRFRIKKYREPYVPPVIIVIEEE